MYYAFEIVVSIVCALYDIFISIIIINYHKLSKNKPITRHKDYVAYYVIIATVK